ncbi:MAG: diaminopimelate epimerase [Mycobacteriales bacterium]
MTTLRYAKGHGTQNDFVVLPDPDGRIDLTPALVRALCDRHAGVGGDGVLRMVPSLRHPEAAADAGAAEWFMDYRNADGSVAEMCGNGVRVFARYLVDTGLVAPGEFAVATRAGVRAVLAPAAGDVTVDIGPAELRGESAAVLGGVTYRGTAVSTGNPHLVCLVDKPVADLDLSAPPLADPAVFPGGVNVEFANVVGPSQVTMRVYERGVGETRSCGTGVCATAAVVAAQSGRQPVTVDVPGGRLTVAFDGTTCLLTGPAVIVAEGTVRLESLRAAATG